MNRIAISEVYYLLESDFNVSGVLQERKSNQRRKMSTAYQLARMNFTPRSTLSIDTISLAQTELYVQKVLEYFGATVETLQNYFNDADFYSDSQDVIPVLVDCGVLPENTTHESQAWIDCDYGSVFVWNGVVFGLWGIVHWLTKSIEIIGVIES